MSAAIDNNFNTDGSRPKCLDLASCSKEEFFRLLAERLGTNWPPLATYLGVSADKIDSIKICHSDTNEQIFQMLNSWLQNLNITGVDNVTQEQDLKNMLVPALRKIHRGDLATEISQGQLRYTQPIASSSSHQTQRSSSGNPIVMPDGVDDKKFRSLAELLPAHWKKLATELGVSSQQIDKIEEKYRDVAEQVFQMLRIWKEDNPSLDHRNCLITALPKIGRRDVAKKVQDWCNMT